MAPHRGPHRGHKSSKVPNVKLRPTAPKQYAAESSHHLDEAGRGRSSLSPDRYGGSSEEDDEGAEEEEGADKPLAGWMFCFTGIAEEKTELTQRLYSMGAMAEGNLTETTTHLVATAVGSSKYNVALELGLPVLEPSFIYAVHDQWQQAQEDIDIERLLRKHALPPLKGYKIGLCGITDPPRKSRTRKLIKSLGAKLIVPMRFEDDVTHLICASSDPQSSTTLNQAYQFSHEYDGSASQQEAAKKIHCVHLDWLEDCQQTRAPLPTERYNVWTVQEVSSDDRDRARRSIPDRSEEAMAERWQQRREEQEDAKRREEEEKRERRLAAKRKTRTTASMAAAASNNRGPAAESQFPEEESMAPKGLLGLSRTVVDSAPKIKNEEEEGERAVRAPETTSPGKAASPAAATTPAPADPPSAWSNLVVRLLPSSSSRFPLARSALRGAGVKSVVTGADTQQADYCVCLDDCPPPPQDPSSSTSTRGRLVSLSWLEECFHYENIIDPATAPWLEPPGVSMPFSLAKSCVVALTGFPANDETPERHHLRKALEAAGCKVTDTFAARENTHLLTAKIKQCREIEQEKGSNAAAAAEMERRGWIKEARALKWKVPLVGIDDFVAKLWKHGIVEPPPSVALGARQSQFQESAISETQTGGRVMSSANNARTNSDVREPKQEDGEDAGAAGGASCQASDDARRSRSTSSKREPGLSKDITNRVEEDTRDSVDDQRRPRQAQAQQPPAPAQPFPATQAFSTQNQASFLTKMQNQVAQLFGPGTSKRPSSAGNDAQQPQQTTSTSSTSSSRRPLMFSGIPAASGSGGGKAPPKSRRVRSLGQGEGGGGSGASSRDGSRSRTASLARDASRSPTKLGAASDEPDSMNEVGGGEDEASLAARLLAQGREQEEARRRRESLAGAGSSVAAAGTTMATLEGDDSSSMRITYRDPQGERERQRLENLLFQEQQGGAAGVSMTQSEYAESLGVTQDESMRPVAAANAKGGGGGGTSLPAAGESIGSNDSRKRQRESMGRTGATTTPTKKRIQARKQPGA